MEGNSIVFADANSSFADAEFVILGVPFDGTCSHRKGTREAPKVIREESYNHETYLFDHDLDMVDVAVFDSGDVSCTSINDMQGGVRNSVRDVLTKNKFPILIGGEHSLTPPAVSRFENIGVVILDAHLDFRDQYLDEKNSHACAARRVFEAVGKDNVISIGVRSIEKNEMMEAERYKFNWVHADALREMGMKKILKPLEWDRIYLSIDMDFFDPSYAPGVGNPEYFGFSPEQAKEAIQILAPRLIGFDICETSPPYDNGNTSSLAARLVREVICASWKVEISKYKDRFLTQYINP